MRKLITVEEFDVITSQPKFCDQRGFGVLEEPAFSELIDFSNEFTGNLEHADANDFLRVYKPKNHELGDYVAAVKNYVGLIQLRGGYQIQILPKIDFEEDQSITKADTDRKRNDTFLKMLKSLKDFPGKNAAIADLKTEKMNLYEVFIGMYIQAARQLVKHGIKSSYIEQEGNLNFYKGKLIFSQHIKTNLAHEERFYVAYEEYLPNRPENRLIKSTLLKLRNITVSARNDKEIRQLLTYFELVDSSVNYDKDFSKVVIDRNTKDYEMLMKWSKVFLHNKSFSTFTGKTSARAILFPMEKLYESYVAQQMKKCFIPDGWEVSTQDIGYHLFTEESDVRKKGIFQLRPDIVMRRDNKSVILDTKWKKLIPERSKNYGITSGDMYQMYAYAKKYATTEYIPEVWMVYPKTKEMEKTLHFDSGDGVKVHVFFVNISAITEMNDPNSLYELKTLIDQSI